mmetsp:Transcript_12043/g.11913  ORF Transcript_12043/g.11913 Transcript_12043/m.11913 type:complete len:108 (-) Transcript_12043:39-362(-)
MIIDKLGENFSVKDVSELMVYQHKKSELEEDEHYHQSKEYWVMLLSFLKVGFNIGSNNVHIYEDEALIELEECEERIKTLREEVIRVAPKLNDVFSLFKKGQLASNN